MSQAGLTHYGILEEDSDIRAHVGVLARRVYVFRTNDARELLRKSGTHYESKPAYQPGYDKPTAQGWCVPWKDIPNIRQLKFESFDWSQFDTCKDTSEKGGKAVKVITELLRIGRFPLWIDGVVESSNRQIQISGTDIVLCAKKKIQVKCDWRAGEGCPQCTGNIYLQESERNPFKRT